MFYCLLFLRILLEHFVKLEACYYYNTSVYPCRRFDATNMDKDLIYDCVIYDFLQTEKLKVTRTFLKFFFDGTHCSSG